MAAKDISDIQVVRAVQVYWNLSALSRNRPYEYIDNILSTATGQDATDCMKAIERAQCRGLVEYGHSLRCCWLTEEGKRVLKENEGK